MENNKLVLVQAFCVHHQIEPAFIEALSEGGLVRVVEVENSKYLPEEDLKEVESMVSFHYELGVNTEGIDVIRNLLTQIRQLQQELKHARLRLDFYS